MTMTDSKPLATVSRRPLDRPKSPDGPTPTPATWAVDVWTLEEAQTNGWDDMVARHPMGSVFQHTAYGKVVATTFKHTRPYYLALRDESGCLRGGLGIFLVKSWLTHNRLVALPFAFYSDPMVQSLQELEVLTDAILKLHSDKRTSYVEIKAHRGAPLLEELGVFSPVYYHKTYYLDLAGGLDALWKGFHRTGVKQKIRRAEGDGITIRAAESLADVAAFCELLAEGRRRLGLPPQNREYFENIWKVLVPLGLARFSIAKKDHHPVGALCSFMLKDTVFLAYIGVVEEFNPSGVGQGLWWEAIQKADRDGYRFVDLGKTSPHADGLSTYKMRWGAVDMEVPALYYPAATRSATYYDEGHKSHQLARKLWTVMPPGIARILARLAYRHMG
jgi:CelD/BcsL family acetyltransferase involved in cellulose biosynthesis